MALAGVRQVIHQSTEQGVHRQLHLFGEGHNQRPLQQRRVLRLFRIDLQHSLPMLRRQAQRQRLAGVPVGVIGVSGEKRIRLAIHAPPGEARRRPGHLHQA
ncbi:hypothetical protein D3C87_1286620 [compost metagenome]